MKCAVRDRVKYHDIHISFYNDWFRHSEVNSDGFTDRQNSDLISLLWEGRLKVPSVSFVSRKIH
jgi:hypothetical protein